MSELNNHSPVDPDYYIGTVTFVDPTHVHLNLPFAAASPGQRGLIKGAVGDYVFIDCEQVRILGRIVENKIPEGERLSIEPIVGTDPNPHLIGRIQLLATLKPGQTKLDRGVTHFPRIGDSVYLIRQDSLASLIQNSVLVDKKAISIETGKINNFTTSESIKFPPELLFGRHCGILGATGGGKSYTVAKLLAEIKHNKGKAILFDPTGEFCLKGMADIFFTFGKTVEESDDTPKQRQVHFPYQYATTDDLFALFKPSGQSQAPKLLDAIESLKLIRAINKSNKSNPEILDKEFNDTDKSSNIINTKIKELNTKHGDSYSFPGNFKIINGQFDKSKSDKLLFWALHAHFKNEISNNECDFEILNLTKQIRNECNDSGSDESTFGNFNSTTYNYAASLIVRINNLIRAESLKCIFGSDGLSLKDEIDSFLKCKSQHVAVISLKDVSFAHQTRPLLINIMGRYLLCQARAGKFKDQPLILFLDEAHQFLDKSIGEDQYQTKLDSFGLIAKEGRKYGLTTVIATQRPRDIPQDVLSQLGILFIHRLTNEHDRKAVEEACGELDRDAAKFIPMLSPGEALIIGSDLPTPFPIKIDRPEVEPSSKGPNYHKAWKANES